MTRSTTSSRSWAEALNTDTHSLLGERLRYSFTDQALLELALTHRSWCAEHPGEASNERLEFLGDSILGLIVSEHTFLTYPQLAEGELSKTRASVVNATTLAEVATELSLGDLVRMGKGEESIGGREKRSILSDAMEAVIGAIYLDGGPAAARDAVVDLLGDRIATAAEGPSEGDYKSRLQEMAARRLEDVPVYESQGEGPDHDKRFVAVVTFGGEEVGRGEGRSKKEAEQEAARAAWTALFEATDADRTPVSDGHDTVATLAGEAPDA